MWAIINGFGGADVLAELDGTNIHRLSNGLTMMQELHTMFDNLWVWFEEIAVSIYGRIQMHLFSPPYSEQASYV